MYPKIALWLYGRIILTKCISKYLGLKCQDAVTNFHMDLQCIMLQDF